MKNKNNKLQGDSQMFQLDTNMLARAYGDEAPLVIDILMFSAKKVSNNSSNEISFSLDEFCQATGYGKDEMQRKLPQFINCPEKIKPFGGDHCFDGTFEYALFKAFTTALVFENKEFEGEGFDLRNLLLIRRIEAEYKNSGEKEKRYYVIELDYRIKKRQLDSLLLNK